MYVLQSKVIPGLQIDNNRLNYLVIIFNKWYQIRKTWLNMATSYTFEIQDIKVYISLIEKNEKKEGYKGKRILWLGKK